MTTNELLPDLSPDSIAAFAARFNAAGDEEAYNMWRTLMKTVDATGAPDIRWAKAVEHVCGERMLDLFCNRAAEVDGWTRSRDGESSAGS